MNIIILVGISGAGKTKWCHEFLKNNENYVRINRDSIRENFIPNHVNTWYDRPDRDNLEKLVTSVVYDLIDITGYYDRDIIIDQTNTNKSSLKLFLANLKRDHGDADIRFKIFDVELKTAQNRVFRRDYPQLVFETDMEVFDYSDLPEVEYIEKQYDNFLETKKWLEENYKDQINL